MHFDEFRLRLPFKGYLIPTGFWLGARFFFPLDQTPVVDLAEDGPFLMKSAPLCQLVHHPPINPTLFFQSRSDSISSFPFDLLSRFHDSEVLRFF